MDAALSDYPVSAETVSAQCLDLNLAASSYAELARGLAREAVRIPQNLEGAIAGGRLVTIYVESAARNLRKSSAYASSALQAWSRAIADHDLEMGRLRQKWTEVQTSSFGVPPAHLTPSMPSEDAAQAKRSPEDRVAAARTEAERQLVRRANAVKEALDDEGVRLAGRLDRGPNDRDWRSLEAAGAVPPAFRDLTPPPLPRPKPKNHGPGFWSVVGDLAGLVLVDPRSCIGDDASKGACGLEIAALTPWTKALKAAKLAKLAKEGDRLDDVADAAKAAPDGLGPNDPWPVTPPIEVGKQGKHQVDHPHFEAGRNRSELDVDPHELAKLAGTGRADNKVERGEPGYREIVDVGRVVGRHVDRDSGVRTPTTMVKIHYSRKGIHVVPYLPREAP